MIPNTKSKYVSPSNFSPCLRILYKQTFIIPMNLTAEHTLNIETFRLALVSAKLTICRETFHECLSRFYHLKWFCCMYFTSSKFLLDYLKYLLQVPSLFNISSYGLHYFLRTCFDCK